MKKLGIFLFTWGFWMALCFPASGAEAPKIGYVDMQKALNFCEAGKEAKKQIAQEVEKVQKIMVAKQKELERLKEDLEKRGSVLSETVRREKERDYQTKLRDLQRLERDYQDDLRRKDQELTGSILRKLEAIVRTIGEERKYTLILEKNQPTVIYISGALDLTEEIIRTMDQKQK